MNINKTVNKLLYALSIKGQLYKINSFQFYSEKNDKYCTKYQILKRIFEKVYVPETHRTELKAKYKKSSECYSKIELMKYLIDEYKKIGSEADEK